MSLVASSGMNENQLRALSRRDLQALAKKEGVKPANASSESLIRRLLAKFKIIPRSRKSSPRPSTKRKAQPIQAQPTLADASARQQRRSARLATAEVAEVHSAPSDESIALVSTEKVLRTSGPTARIPPAVDPVHAASQPPAAGPSTVPASNAPTALPAPTSEHVESDGSPTVKADSLPRPGSSQSFASSSKSHPTQPPYPTDKHLIDCHRKMRALNTELVEIGTALPTMERMLPRLEDRAESVKADLTTFVWNGFYLEREYVIHMKNETALWDGTKVMRPGPKRDAWNAFMADMNQKNDPNEQQPTDDEDCTDSDTSSASRKRHRRLRDSSIRL
ncbi:hypothetical protein C8R43DRAFT_1046083 [Mycena crocata]|nr:hypothetical protein C8R43DRAFT_1046083 [Mycena crocata]